MGAGKKAGLNPHRKPGGQVTAAGGQTFVISWVGFDYNYTCVVTCSSSPERNGNVIVRHENDVIRVMSYRLTFQMTKLSKNRD